MNLATIETTSGVSPYDELGLQVVMDQVPGTPDTAGTPIICTDFTAEMQEAEDWVTQRAEGFKEDAYSAVVREWVTVTGNLAPDYDLLLWKFLCLFGLPVVTTPVTVDGEDMIDYEFRLPAFGSVERPLFTAQWGRPDSAFRCPYGLIQSMSISNAASGNTEGNLALILKKGEPNQVMIGHGANEIVTLTVDGLAAPVAIVIPNTPLGLGGNVMVDPDMTGAELRTLLGEVPAIRRAANVRVIGETVAGDGEFVITFINQLALANIAPITTASADIDIVATTAGSRVVVVAPQERPILPKHWWYRQGETRALALAADKILDVETHEVTFADMANPHYTENQEGTFRDHVDGPVNVGCSIGIAYDDDPDSVCAQMEAEAKGWTANSQWRLFGADAPDGLRSLVIGVHASVNGTRPRGDENNVYRRTFPFTRKRNHNAAEGYSFFAVLRLPAP